MNINQKKKTAFRNSVKWKNFRKKMKELFQVDFLTNRPLYKGWNLHHCDMKLENYTDTTNTENFYCLNKQSHEIVHILFRYKDWREILKRLFVILERMETLNN